MDIRDLKYFVQIYETKSFSTAARQMYVTQQTLSKAIRKMEDELGVRLFIRDRKGMIPTEPCRTLYERALPLLSRFDVLTENLKDIDQPVRGTICIGMHKDFDALYYSDILHRFSRSHPNVEIDISSIPGKQSERRVIEEELDFGANILPVDEDKFIFQKIFEDEIAVLVHRDSALAVRVNLSCADLAHENILLPSNRNNYYDLVRRAFHGCTNEPKFVPCNAHVGFMINLVVAGEGVALVSTANIKWRDLRGLVVPRKFVPSVKRTCGFIHKRGCILSGAATAFRDFLETEVPFTPHQAFQGIFKTDAPDGGDADT